MILPAESDTMKQLKLILLTGSVAILLAGCATQQARTESGRERTAYTVPVNNDTASSNTAGWTLKPPSDNP